MNGPTAATSAVRIRGLRKSYRGAPPAVDGLDLEVSSGSCFGLLGPNGAGKTTTIRVLCASSPRDAGDVEVLGLDPAREPRALKARLGLVQKIMGALLVVTGLLFLSGSINALGQWMIETFPALAQIEDLVSSRALQSDIMNQGNGQ